MFKPGSWTFPTLLLIVLHTIGALGGDIYAQTTRSYDATYHYDGSLNIEPEHGTISAKWIVSVLDPNIHKTKFLLRGTIDTIHLKGAGLDHYSVGESEDWEGFNIINVAFTPAQNGTPRVIEISYDGVLFPTPPEQGYNAITPTRIDLHLDGYWFPIDRGLNKTLTAELMIDAGTGWTPVSTDDLRYQGDRLNLSKTHPGLDISFTLTKGAVIRKGKHYTRHDLRQDQGGIDRIIDAADFCIEYLNGHFGATRPLPHTDIMINDRKDGGFARRHYISLPNVHHMNNESMTAFICHEFSHYWTTGASAGSADRWLDEGFATYVESMALRAAFGEDLFVDLLAHHEKQVAEWINKNKTSKKPTWVWSEEDQRRRPTIISYKKGSLALNKLEDRLGREKFMIFMQNRMARPVHTTPQLLEILADVTDEETAAWFQDVLGQ